MLVLVDGYNVTMADPALQRFSKEAQRDALCARLRVLAPVIAPKGRVIVVFDAHISPITTAEDAGGLKVLYADSADAEIVKQCAAARGNVTVYTNDMRLRARISQDVGRRIKYSDASPLFVGNSSGAAGDGPRRADGDSRRGGQESRRADAVGSRDDADALPKHQKKSITEELSRLWSGADDDGPA